MRTCFTWVIAAVIATSSTLSLASTPSQQSDSLSNVQLAANGTLRGLLVTAEGQPVAGETVRIHAQGDMKTVAHTVVSDRNGRFQVAGLKSGTLVVSVKDNSYACRVWAEGMAPPASVKTAAFVTGQQVVRGQNGRPGFMNRIYSLTTKQKVCLGLIVAAAIAIPIALDDDDNAS